MLTPFNGHLIFLCIFDKLTLTLVPEAIYRDPEERWREGEERSEGEEKSPLVESVGNLTSMLSPSTEIEPRR